MKSIDLNCDMGEIPEAIADGTQETLLGFITSANIACGGHAGDDRTMETTIRQALAHNVACGAHPGYADRENFGRVEADLSGDQIAEIVYEQVRRFSEIAARLGVPVTHIKPHGALYNQAVKNTGIARAIAEGVSRWSRSATLVGLANSPMLEVFRSAGFRVAAEAFADRRYEPDGSLRNRRFPDALIRDPEEASEQALRIAEEGIVVASGGTEVRIATETICVHGDTPGATQIAAAIHHKLRAAGIRLCGLAG